LKQGRRIFFILLLIVTTLGLFVGCSSTQNVQQNQVEGPNRFNNQQTETKIEFISAAKRTNPLERMILLDDSKVDINQDGQEESVELYAAAEKDSRGELAWDDGQPWLLKVIDGDYEYILFDDYVQLGDLNYWIYTSEQNTVHITTMQDCDAGFLVTDYKFDVKMKRFEKVVVFNPQIANMLDYSRY